MKKLFKMKCIRFMFESDKIYLFVHNISFDKFDDVLLIVRGSSSLDIDNSSY